MQDRLTLMRRVATAMLALGALASAAGVPTSATTLARFGQGGAAAGFALCGLALVLARPRRRAIEAAALIGILLLGGLIALGDPIGTTPYYYLWPVAFLAYFATTRLVAVAFATLTATFAVALALNPAAAHRVDTFTGTLISVGLIAVLTILLNRNEARLRARLALAAETDPLTGLLNRRAFNPRLAALLAQAGRRGRPVSVVMLDLDEFKRFNDTHGHLAGDEALRRAADVLRDASRAGDLVCRFGGEEFAVALPDADLASARRYADRVARTLCRRPSGDAPALTASAGIATLTADGATVDALLTRADQALYAAKAAGRARAAWWDGRIRIGEVVRCEGVPAAA